jgi:hypothetical protein
MTRRALLIGAATGGLAGVANDVAAMTRVLQPRGFLIDTLSGAAATRDGIVDAYRRLIADAGPGDACVIYYSGHGGRLPAPDGVASARPDLQFIVPTDFDDSTDDDFRGITGVELSVLLAGLTAVTPNVTVVLDCCHAAHLSRQTDLRVKALLRPMKPNHDATYDSVQRHVDRLVAQGLPVYRRDMHSNPHAVRVVACAPHQSAWEGANRDGVQLGLLTDALTRLLAETVGVRVNWLTMLDAIRRKVQDLAPAQRPTAEGPSSRQPFELTDLYPVATLPVVGGGPDRVRLLGAPLIGVQLGDEFAILPADASDPGAGPIIGTATVDELAPMAACAELHLSPGWHSVPEDARAHCTVASAPALPVRLPDGPAGAELRKVLANRLLLRAADPDEETAIVVVADAHGRLTVHDDLGPLHPPYPPTPFGVDQVVANLQRLAQATTLRRIGGDPAAVLGDPAGPQNLGVTVEWGRVRGGQSEPFPTSGALVYADLEERVYIRVRNDGDAARFVSLVDIGISSRIGLLTAADQGGRRLARGETFTYGWNEDTGRLTGVEVTWPAVVEPSHARLETVLVIISDDALDVSVLQQSGLRSTRSLTRARLTTGSPLERLLAQAVTGAVREIGSTPGRKVRHTVVPIDFTVSPTAPPAAERVPFLVDDRPSEPVRLLSPRGALPSRVAVRINELVVHRNRALGGADIRVDSVVLTSGRAGPLYHQAATMRFSDIRDDTRLPLDNALIYLGPAVDFLDLAIWVSRDTSDSLALGDLLAQTLTDPSVQAAGAQAAGLALTAPQAAAAVAAAGACAVVVNTAYRVLLGVVGQSVGLYRTSLLAQEQFGIGRHERHPQDFSITFSIEPVA